MREKIVLIGAGSAMFLRGLLADLLTRGWEADLGLVDVDPRALDVAAKLCGKMVEARRAPVRIQASVDRREILPGATVAICTVGVGGRRAWEQDVFIPRRHGIYQPVGDTVMPGGNSRALRMIPAMVGVARDVLDLAPTALFFNYGNPMSAVCRAIRKATGANVVGLCHGVHNVAGYLAKALATPPADLKYTAVGINHLTWFVDLQSKGRSLMPALLEMARRPAPDNPFSWWLTDLFGAFPAPRDRHVTEYFPQFFADGNYYGKKLGVDAFPFEERITRGEQIFARMCEDALSPGALAPTYFDALEGEHEQVLDIVQSIRRDEGRIYSVNLPNQGQCPNLLAEAVIESPGRAGTGGIRSLPVAPLSTALAGIVNARLSCVETIVEAALEGSRPKFVQALILDGAVGNPAMAEKLADELLIAQAEYLPQFRRSSNHLAPDRQARA
jgi:alpha-galactosidase